MQTDTYRGSIKGGRKEVLATLSEMRKRERERERERIGGEIKNKKRERKEQRAGAFVFRFTWPIP